jgi:hypothetical protein
MPSPALYLLLLPALLLHGCDVFGSKDDATTDAIFEAGQQDPTLLNEVEYVPLFPFFTGGGDGQPLDAPQDVYAGFDGLLYVVDARGLHVLDLSGRAATFLPIPAGGTSVIQDRRLHVFVTARRDTTLGGRTWNLPVVLHYDGLSTGQARLVQVLWHPFDDASRRFTRPDPVESDTQVAFTGVAVLPDNRLFVSRRGPDNSRATLFYPHNTVLEFSPEGENIQALVALNPSQANLRSAVNPSDVLTFVHPPQRSAFPPNRHFVIAQSPPDGVPLQFAVLSVLAVETPDGIEYRPDTPKLTIASDPTRGTGFLYESFRFHTPSDLAFAADGTNYLFVLDAGKDSLFVFTAQGVEGVAPPPGARTTQPVVVSFGGTGDAALQFRHPQGVAYFDRTVYVADTGNHRLARYRLNTDFE